MAQGWFLDVLRQCLTLIPARFFAILAIFINCVLYQNAIFDTGQKSVFQNYGKLPANLTPEISINPEEVICVKRIETYLALEWVIISGESRSLKIELIVSTNLLWSLTGFLLFDKRLVVSGLTCKDFDWPRMS